MNYRELIKEEVIKYGFNISNRGTIYIIESIDIICNSNNYLNLLSNLEKNVYEKIAIKYDTSVKTVKSNIVKATNNVWYLECTQNLNKDEPRINKVKYTPKSVISHIVDNILK